MDSRQAAGGVSSSHGYSGALQPWVASVRHRRAASQGSEVYYMKCCPWILSIRGVGEKASAESPKTSFDLQGKLTGGGHGSDPGAWPSQASQPAKRGGVISG